MRRRGFTAVDLMVVIGINAFLVVLLVPAVQQSRASARRTQCKNNLKQLGLGLHNYHDTYNCFPAGVQYRIKDGRVSTWSWMYALLPYGGQEPYDGQELFVQISDVGDLRDAVHQGLMGNMSGIRCPSDILMPTTNKITEGALPGIWAYTNYLGVSGTDSAQSSMNQSYEIVNPESCQAAAQEKGHFRGFQAGTLFGGRPVGIRDITDGTSNTLLVCERAIPESGQFGWWSGTGNVATCPVGWGDVVLSTEFGVWNGISSSREERDVKQLSRWWSRHTGGINVLMADGSIRFLSESLDTSMFKQLSTRQSEGSGEF